LGLHDADYRPDLVLSESASNYIEYGASNDVGSILKQERRKEGRQLPTRSGEAAEGFYQNWLGEVRYIISDEENDEFSRLKTTTERERFITSFWRRRDPRPETEEK
jgi:hypothetical protein